MALVDLNKPGVKKKVIWAAVLGLVGIIFLWWTFFGFGSRSWRTTQAAVSPSANPRPAGQHKPGTSDQQAPTNILNLAAYPPIVYQRPSYDATEARRNISVSYLPTKPCPTPKVEVPPSPTPTPPMLLASIP